MVLKLVKKLADPKLIKKLTDDVVQPVSKQTDEALEESFFKIREDVASPEIKQTDQILYKDEKISNVEYDKRIKELDKTKDVETWQAEAKKLVKNERLINPEIKTPELKISAKNLIENKITRKEHLANVDKYKPVSSWDNLPREPSNKALVYALDADKREKGLFVLAKEIAKDLKVKISALKIGDIFNGRLDIPAYTKHDTWIISGTSPNVRTKEGGGVTNYAKAVHYGSKEKPVKFIAAQKSGEKIGTGEVNKFPYATISGVVKDLDVNRIRQKAIKYLNDPEWTQAGFDPRRQSSLYVRSGENKHVPIREGSEVIQIGPLVLVKNAKLDFAHTGYDTGGDVKREFEINSYEYDGKEQPVIDFKDGGRLTLPQIEQMFGEYGTATEPLLGRNTGKRILKFLEENNPTKEEFIKHFTSIELNKGGTIMKDQMEMTFMSEGGSFPDLTGDGIVTKKDILRGRGIDGFEEGGLRDEGGTVDPVSGNDVPSGSNKSEVRDDIPAMLSEGEFVFPADVVRYIGLSKLMELRQEAKMGLKVMEEMGQMGNSEEATLPNDFGIPDIEIIEDDDEELDGMDDDDDENDMDNMTESGKMMVMEKRAQGGVIKAAEGTDVSKGVGAVLMPDGTIDSSRGVPFPTPPDGVKIPPQQPQQTQFEQMMGYGAGQGSTRYNANRVPYTKADGTIVNILEDYMGRPMQDTEGLTRVTPYQAGPVFGGGVQPVQPIQPVLPPMPVDPTDDTAARREQERKDKRKEAKEADRRKALDAQIDKDIINFQDMGDPRFVGKTEKEARDAYYGMDFSERAGMAKQDLGYKASSLIDALPLSRAAKTKAKALVDKKTTTPEQRRKRKRDSEEGVGAFADKSLSREERQKDKIESDAIDKIKDKKEKDKARDKARKRREDRDKAAGKKRVADYKANKDSVRGQGGRAKGGLMKKDYP